MKRISLLMIALSFLAFVGVAKAQLTLTVNDGTTTNDYVPIYGLYVDDYLRCQYVQPAADLSQMIGGTINSLTFYLSRLASASWGDANFQVYLKEVESTSISTFIDPATATMVYDGSLDGTQSTMTVTFSTPYTYTGGNLLIGFDNTVEGSWKSCSFFGVTAEGASVQGYSSTSVAAVSPTQRNFLPKMDITYLPGSGDPVVVESIEASDVTVYTGHTAQINYTVLPADAWYKQVSFASANTSIATVNENGLVTAVAVGETTITITSVEYPTISTTINVSVEYFPTLNEALNVNGGTLEFTNDATYPWTVEIDGDRIYAMSGNGGVASSVSTLTLVVNAAEGDALSFDFKAWGEGTNTIYDHSKFSVDDEPQFDYGAYDNDWETYNYVFTAGEHTLTWTFTKDGSVNGTGDYFAIDNVTYEPIIVTPVESITADDITMMTGETAQITPTVLPADANQAVTYASANTSIATVSEDGLVTAVASGTTTITITSVSTPEVSTTINVTVNSNPDNVVFTVNAPATAQPDDVITVEAYLNAPASGNYNGFTGLTLGIHFDTDAFEPFGNPVKGPVAEASMMSMGTLPNETYPDLVQMACVMVPGNPNTTTGLVFSMQFTVLAETGSYDFYAEPTWASETVSNFVNNPGTGGVNIPYEVTPSTVAVGLQTITKTIEAYGDSEKGGYYLIASPVTQEVTPTAENGFLSETAANYDLYYFDQVGDAEGKEWINFKDESMGGFYLTNGTGYLYASKEGTTLSFTGTPYSGDGVIQLTYDENAEEFAGYNLVGNPFLEAATPNREYYVMNPETRDEIIQGDEAVPAMEGAFVVAEGEGETVTFEPGNKKKSRLAINLIIERGVIDRAVVNFGSNSTLPKFQLNPNHSKVYIPMEGKDYAVVSASEMGEMPVSFKAESNGNYTLSLNAQEVSFAYLHLIDNMTGKDQDMLSNPSYTFDARTTDYANRFKLVFATGNATDEFAFFSNGSFVINNEGNAIVQVIDVNGRIISSESINGCANVNVKAAAGVYMFRLVNGNDVKVQKVVVK